MATVADRLQAQETVVTKLAVVRLRQIVCLLLSLPSWSLPIGGCAQCQASMKSDVIHTCSQGCKKLCQQTVCVDLQHGAFLHVRVAAVVGPLDSVELVSILAVLAHSCAQHDPCVPCSRQRLSSHGLQMLHTAAAM